MGILELSRFAVTALRAHPLRSFLTTLGIVISVWTIVSVRSVIDGMNDYVLGNVFSLAPDVFVVTRFGIITSREEFTAALKRKAITSDEIERLRELCGGCADVGVESRASFSVNVGNRRIPDIPVIGATPNVAELKSLDVADGRFFNESEDFHRSAVAVIGWEIRTELYPRLDPIGRKIQIGGVPHEVIGVLAKQGSVLGQEPDLNIYTPKRTTERQTGRGREANERINLLVRAAGGVTRVEAARQEVIQIFRWLRHTPMRGPDPVGIVTAEMVGELWRNVSRATFVFVMVISGISLFVGAIVVANIMLVSVIERTREIGLRLALGARKRDVRRQFVLEAALLSLVGGAVGTLAGALTAWFVATQWSFPASVRLLTVVAALGTAGLAGVLAGVFPARKAANLPPIEALRHE